MPPRSLARVSTFPSLRGFTRTTLGVALAGPAVISEAFAQAGPEALSTALPAISVEGSVPSGYQTDLPSLNKLTEPLVDVPQTVNVIPKQLLQDQAITTTREALRNVPGISLGAGEAGAQGDNLTLRGFAARNDFYLDGMRDFGSYTRDPFNLQEIEVLKGPASVLFGRGSTGGVINQVSKQPLLSPVTAGTGTLGTDGTRRLTLDFSRPIEGSTAAPSAQSDG